MTIDDLVKLKHLSKCSMLANTTWYRYDTFIPDRDCINIEYYPTCIRELNVFGYICLLDFTETAKDYLTHFITSSTASDVFINDVNPLTRKYSINEITVEQAQEIIDRNIVLFRQIQQKVKENELIKQIDEL